jgi:hypothetical protein
MLRGSTAVRTISHLLAQRKIHLWVRGEFQPVSYVADNGHHRSPRLLSRRAGKLHALPQRVFSGPIARRERLVDRNHRLAFRGVLAGKLAPAQHGYLHGPEIRIADSAVIRVRVLPRLRFRLPFDSNGPCFIHPAQGEEVGDRSVLDAGEVLHALDQLLIKTDRLRVRGVFRIGQGREHR